MIIKILGSLGLLIMICAVLSQRNEAWKKTAGASIFVLVMLILGVTGIWVS